MENKSVISIQELVERYNKLSNSNDSWKIYEENQKEWYTIWKPVKGSLRCKCQFTLDVDVATARAFFSDPSKRSEWDELCTECRILEISEEGRAVYLKSKPQLLVSGRHEVLWQAIQEMENIGGVMLLSAHYGEDDGRFKLDEKLVKMTTHISGIKITPREGGCLVSQVIDADYGGWVPGSFLKEITIQKAAKNIKKIRSSLDKQ